MPNDTPLFEVKADLFKALGHPIRIRALEVLVEGPRTVSELLPDVGVEQAHLSQQLRVLRNAGLVSTVRDGTSVVYSIRDERLVDLLRVARDLLIGQLEDTRDLLEELEGERESA